MLFIITREEKHKTTGMWKYGKRYKKSLSKFNQDFIKYSKVIIFHVTHIIQTDSFRWQSTKFGIFIIYNILLYFKNYYWCLKLWGQKFFIVSALNGLFLRGACVCLHACLVYRINFLWTPSLWIISSGTPSALLRFGFSKVERVLSLIGEFLGLGIVPYPLKGFANSTRNIESVIKACTNTLFAYLSQWHPANLPELPICWAALLLSI